MKTFARVILMVGAVALFLGNAAPLWAQDPGISLEVIFDKDSYTYGEPIGVTVKVKNELGEILWVSPKYFSKKLFYRYLRINDPSSRLLQPEPMAEPPPGAPPPVVPEVEAPDAPPLPWVNTPGGLVRAAFCERLDAGWESEPWQERTDDLREHYALELPGYYLLRAEISVMIHGDSHCNVDQPKWVGVLKSDPQSIYMEGSTKVKVKPEKWHLKWKKKGKKEEHVKVEIWPEEGKTVDDYQLESIRLNNLEARKVKASRSKIKASFSRKDAIESLGAVEVGQLYEVIVSGRLKNGLPFGGGQKIRVVGGKKR